MLKVTSVSPIKTISSIQKGLKRKSPGICKSCYTIPDFRQESPSGKQPKTRVFECISNGKQKEFNNLIRHFGLDIFFQNAKDCGYASDELADYIIDLQAGLSNVKDKKIKEFVEEKFSDADKMDMFLNDYDCFEELQNAGDVVDAYNELNGNYMSYIQYDYSNCVNRYPIFHPAKDYLDFSVRYGDKKYWQPWFTRLERDIDFPKKCKNYMNKDFINSQKVFALERVCINSPKIADYLYQNYYLKKLRIPKEEKQIMQEIFDKYGCKIILSAKSDCRKGSLNFIKREFDAWHEASEGAAKYPILLNCNKIDHTKNSDAKAHVDTENKIMRIHGMDDYSLKSLRHEMIHLNDPYVNYSSFYDRHKHIADLTNEIIASKVVKPRKHERECVLDFDNCKYREELLDAGATPSGVEYAYTNRKELLAVAGSCDTSKFSEQFKKDLVTLGLPEYVFKLPLFDLDISWFVSCMEDIHKMYPEEKDYNKLAKYLNQISRLHEMYQ